MNEFRDKVVQKAREYEKPVETKGVRVLTDPITVAGLADVVKNARAAMARAKAASDNLTASSSELLDHIAKVEAVHSQVTAANAELKTAIESIGAPLDGSQHSESNLGAVSATGQKEPGADGGAMLGGTVSTTSASPLNPPSQADVMHGVKSSIAEVQVANGGHPLSR